MPKGIGYDLTKTGSYEVITSSSIKHSNGGFRATEYNKPTKSMRSGNLKQRKHTSSRSLHKVKPYG